MNDIAIDVKDVTIRFNLASDCLLYTSDAADD